MDKGSLPSLRRDGDETPSKSIFENTAVELPLYTNSKPPHGYNRNKLNVSKKAGNSAMESHNNIRNNNFMNTRTDMGDSRDGQNDSRLVPMGYFEKIPNTGSVSEVHTSTRFNENKIVSNIELPKLNKTIRSETLYSLKSQQNSSPHARIMQTLEKRKKKKAVMPDSNMNIKSQDNLIKPKKTSPMLSKNRANRNNHNNTKQFYEITTIEEESTSQNFNQSGKKSTYGKKQNNRYQSLNPDLSRDMGRNYDMEKSEHKRNVSLSKPSSELDHEAENHQYSMGAATYDQNERKQEVKKSPIKPLLPRLGGRIDGITTKNGTFKPYTYSVS